MNNNKMKRVIKKVFKDLSDMDEKEFKKEFKKEFEEHKSGDIAEILLKTGALGVISFENNNCRV